MTVRSGRTLSVVAAVLLSGLAVGCSKGSSRDALDEYRVTSEDAEPSLSMTVSVDAATVALGDDIVFRVKLTNDGDAVTDVGVPRIDRRSLRLRVTKDGGRVVVVERLHGDIDPTTGRFIPSPGASRQLEPGASFETEIRTPAVATGAYRIVATLDRPGQAPLVGDPLDVAVTPKDGRSGLGVRIATSKGDVLVRMRPDLAYNHVESFVSLVKQGFYDGLKFHRVIPGFMAQGGDPKGDGSGGPGYLLPLEAHSKLYHDRGILSMARMSPPDTAGSQFFLMFTRYPSLDPGFQRQPGYTVFGKMVEGDATLDALEAQGSAPEGRTRELLRIESMRVELLDSAD